MSRLALILLVLGCILGSSLAGKNGYEGYHIYEVQPSSTEQADLLHQLSKEGYDFFSLSKLAGKPSRVLVSPTQLDGFNEFMLQHSIAHQLLNSNVGASVAEEQSTRQRLRRLSPFTGKGRLSTERYYTHEEIINYIDDLAVRFPTRVFLKTVGWSFEKRVLKTITITNGDGRANKKVFFVDGGFHAREWISPASVLYLIDQLVEHFDENQDLLKDHDWIILPVVNPDGYEHTQTDGLLTRMWRKTRQPYKYLGRTCNGADPNRNFDFHWNEEGASSTPCSDTYAGPKAFSEPETIVVRDLMHTLAPRGVMYLTIHSYGNYLLYPWGWTDELPDTWKDLDEVAYAGFKAIEEATGTIYTYGSSTNVLYIAAGASDDYGFVSGFPISMTMELSGGGLTGFDPPASKIEEFASETWIGIRAMAEKVIEKY